MTTTVRFNLWSIQPFKAVFVYVSLFGLCLVRVPYWTLRNLFRSWRPRPSWTLSRCIQSKFIKHIYQLMRAIGGFGKSPDHRALQLGRGVQGLFVNGVSPNLILGDVKRWADIANVEPLRIPGYWHNRPGMNIIQGEKPLPNEKVLYHMHGGAYAFMSAHPSSPVSSLVTKLLKHAPLSGSLVVRRAFAIEYRLTMGGQHPFPAQLLDALAGYKYLVDMVGFQPENVIFVGDSAGANLVLALTRYLVEYGPSSLLSGGGSALPPPPGALVLLSAWCDLSGSHETPGSLAYKNMASDYLVTPMPKPGELRAVQSESLALVEPFDHTMLSNKYISPASLDLKHPEDIDFVGFPRTFSTAGGGETLLDQIETLEKRMMEDMGVENVRSFVSKDAPHDTLVLKFLEPERTELANEIGRWIEGL